MKQDACSDKSQINKLTIFKCFIIATLILLGAQIPYFNVIALLLSCCLIFAGSAAEMLHILLFTLAFSPIFKLHPSGYTFYNILFIAGIVKLLLINPKVIFRYNQLILLLLFASYVLIFGGTSAIVRLVNIYMGFILMLLIFNQNEKINPRSILLFFSLGIIIASFAGVFSTYIPGLDSYVRLLRFKIGVEDYVLRFCGLQSNPNFYTMDISIALSGWFGLIVSKRAKLMDYLLIIILSVFGIMSISKSFLVMYLILLLLVLISSARQNISGLIKGLVAAGIMVIIIYFITDKDYINAYLFRLLKDSSSSADLSSITTGRYDLWVGYLSYIWGSAKVLFFGEGLGAGVYILKASHNYILETIYYLGILGATLYWLCIINILPQWDLNFKRSLVNYMPLIILLTRGMAINLIMRENLIFFIIIIAVMLNTDLQTRQNATTKVSFV